MELAGDVERGCRERGNRLLTIAAAATAVRILPAMSLSESFYWTTRSASRPGDPLTVIACEGVWIVVLSQRVDGWDLGCDA